LEENYIMDAIVKFLKTRNKDKKILMIPRKERTAV
jgi:hypothetical protein